MGKAVGKVLKVVAVVASVAAAVATAGVSLGLTATLLTGIAAVSALGASLLSPKPKPPEQSRASTDRLTASINPRAPRTIGFGTTALPAELRL